MKKTIKQTNEMQVTKLVPTMISTKKQAKEMQVTNVVTNDFTPMQVTITMQQGAQFIERKIEQKIYNKHFGAIIGSKFELFKSLFSGKNKVFDATLSLPITFEMQIVHSVYNDTIKGEIETNNAKRICMLLNNEFCKTFNNAPSLDISLLERTKFLDKKNKMAMPKETRHTFVGVHSKLETEMQYPIAQLN